jgi:hypothetical protein
MSKKPTPQQWAKLFPEAWKALCNNRAAVMPIDLKIEFNEKPSLTTSRNLAFRLDQKPRR